MRTPLLVMLVLMAWALTACPSRQLNSKERAQATWAKHERVLIALRDNQDFNWEEFEEACIFYLDLTGIEVPSDGSYVSAWTPIPESASVLPELREWYANNKERLYWDPENEKVLLKAPQDLER